VGLMTAARRPHGTLMTGRNDETMTRRMVPERACIVKDHVEAEALVRVRRAGTGEMASRR